MSSPLLKVFVYGTLKRGYWNHEPTIGAYRSVEACTIRGRLHRRHTGTPILEIPPAHVLAVGTRDAMHDLHVQEVLAREWRGLAAAEDNSGRWLDVRGELYALGDAAEALARLDALEGFQPETPGVSLYDRVLAPVGGGAAWVYVIPEQKSAADYSPARDPACWRAENEAPSPTGQ